ncbi:MAG: DUF2851 family protein [Candidatus Cloacimonadota bacterium]|nr:DUF2851 family protein [Candidatus Cloacimonadota bacterium]
MDFSERFLYHIWDAQHLQSELQTVSGNRLKIISPGRWNTGSGPDFINAKLQIDGKEFMADIEIDLYTYNWKLHHHNENPDFNRVGLHVVYRHNTNLNHTIREDGTIIEVFQMKNFLDDSIEKLVKQYDEFKLEAKFCEFFAGLHPTQVEFVLTELGKLRLKRKIKRFSSELKFNSFEQVLYQGILEALGYSKNKLAMLNFAGNVNYDIIKEAYQNGMSKQELIAIYLKSSGLLQKLPASFSEDWCIQQEVIYKNQNFVKIEEIYDWNLFRIRPHNHPGIRLIEFAELLYPHLQFSFFQDMLKMFSFPKQKFTISEFRKRLYGFFGNQQKILDKYAIGKTRIDTILINIILPIVILYAKEKNFVDLEKTARKVYLNYKALPSNHLIRHMQSFMDDVQIKKMKKKAVFQQGLLKLYFDNCCQHRCIECEKLKTELLK